MYTLITVPDDVRVYVIATVVVVIVLTYIMVGDFCMMIVVDWRGDDAGYFCGTGAGFGAGAGAGAGAGFGAGAGAGLGAGAGADFGPDAGADFDAESQFDTRIAHNAQNNKIAMLAT